MDFSKDNLRNVLAASTIGNEIYFFKEIESTNTVAVELAKKEASEGSVVIADCQTKGRGRRLNRVWQSPAGKNLYTSIIFRPSIKASIAPQLTLTAGVAMAELLSEYCPDNVKLKWPNDVLINGKKVCGILTEMRMTGEGVDFVIVGIGVNINMKNKDFQEELRNSSTSLMEETARTVSRTIFAARLYKLLGKWYGKFLEEGFLPVREQWLKYSGILGKVVEVNHIKDIEKGLVSGIDEDGALLIYNEENEVKRVLSGDVSFVGE